jgi:hypothetical protein
MKQIFFHSKYRYLFSLLFALVGIAAYFLLNEENQKQPILAIANSTFIVGFVLILVGGLSILSNLGAFDIYSYQFKRKGTGANRYTLYDHQQKRIEQSKGKQFNFVPYMTVGLFFVIISAIFTFVFYGNV